MSQIHTFSEQQPFHKYQFQSLGQSQPLIAGPPLPDYSVCTQSGVA